MSAELTDFRAIFEGVPARFLILDPDLNIVAATDSYVEATMIDRAAVIGRHVFEVFPDNPDDPSAEGVRNLRTSLDRVLRNKTADSMAVQRYDVRRPDSEGGGFEERYWSPTNTPLLGPDGELRYLLHRAEDVTEYMRARDAGAAQQHKVEEMEAEVLRQSWEVSEASRKLKDANAELAELNSRLTELDELKTQFFANVTHELRTPLTLILAPTEKLLTQLGDDDPLRPDLEVVVRNARVLLREVNQLLDSAKLEAGGMVARYVEFDLPMQIRRIGGFFESLAAERKIDYRIHADGSTRAQLDPDHLKRIVINLLSNAFKVTPDGGVIRCSLVQDLAAGRVRIEVADSGPGIAPEHRETVFERFRQLDGGATRTLAGTGLGLSIVRDVIRLHGGVIRASQAPEGGALFAVTLPLRAPSGVAVSTGEHVELHVAADELGESIRPAATVQVGQVGHDQGASDDDSADRPLVLVVEDNVDLNGMLADALSDRYRVVAAYDGAEGFAAARNHSPDLVLCDVMMPKVSGADLVRAIRADAELSLTPILVLSARAEEAGRLALLEAGANDYVAKPFSLAELRVRTDNLVTAAQAEARLRDTELMVERDRIAEDLHHKVVRNLFSISLQLSSVRPQAHGPLAERLYEATAAVDAVIRDIRSTVFEAEPAAGREARVGQRR